MHLLRVWGSKWRQCTRVGPKHRDLRMGIWNITSLNGKEQESVWQVEQCCLDIVKVSFTKRRGSDTVELNEGWKLFYSGVDVTRAVTVHFAGVCTKAETE